MDILCRIGRLARQVWRRSVVDRRWGWANVRLLRADRWGPSERLQPGVSPQLRTLGAGGRNVGLVVLEWLLIVAAVAGLAALAVVLAQSVVDDTAEQIGNSSARRTAAAVAAQEVERQARAATPTNARTATWADWERHFSAPCARLTILYSDIALRVDAAFGPPTTADDAEQINETLLVSAPEAAPTTSTPQVRCNIDEPDVAFAGDEAADDEIAEDVVSPLPSIDDFRLAAQAIAEAAATLRPGDTWETWKAHFEPLCADLAIAYAHLNIGAESSFNRPRDQNSTDPVTQNLLDAASNADAANGRPQIKCQVQQ